MMAGVKLPARREHLPISDDDYKRRFKAFLDEKGPNDPKHGFFYNWVRYLILGIGFAISLRRSLMLTETKVDLLFRRSHRLKKLSRNRHNFDYHYAG